MTMLRALLPVALLLIGCAGASPEGDDASAASDAIVDGAETFEHPEIGLFHNGGSYCTATLIRANVVLTAAHCVTGGHKDEAVTGYSFDVESSAASPATHFEIDRAYTIPVAADFDGTQNWRLKDIALLRLTTPVPAALAQPLAVATSRPNPGDETAIYGFGCTSRVADANGHRPGGGVKRKAELAWHSSSLGSGASTNVCPGDSGGPWLDVAANAVFGTTSGIVNEDDRFGDVPASAAEINRVADAWSATTR
jgi:V8-like Glu-specific endopeptidase